MQLFFFQQFFWIYTWNPKAIHLLVVGYQLDDEPILYIGNGWKSPFPSNKKWLFGVPGKSYDILGKTVRFVSEKLEEDTVQLILIQLESILMIYKKY